MNFLIWLKLVHGSFWVEHHACALGLNRTGHMSFLTGQDRTPKFAGQVLPDRTKPRLIFLNILHTKSGVREGKGLVLKKFRTSGPDVMSGKALKLQDLNKLCLA